MTRLKATESRNAKHFTTGCFVTVWSVLGWIFPLSLSQRWVLVRYGAEDQPPPFEKHNDCAGDLTTMVGCSRVVLFSLDTCPNFPETSSSEGLKHERRGLWVMSVTYCALPLIKALGFVWHWGKISSSQSPPNRVWRKCHCGSKSLL